MPSSIPLIMTPTFGREAEVRRVTAALTEPGNRIVTLAGPGGVGKTRLLLSALHALPPETAASTWFVSLAPVRTADDALPAIAAAVGLRGTDTRQLTRQVGAALADGCDVLALDNLEQIRDAAPLLLELLQLAPALTLAITSRVPLHLPGEIVIPVAPLPVPDAQARPDPETVRRNPSVALLMERATRLEPGLALAADTAEAISGICRQLDGIPLALELAAPWLRLLAPAELQQRLEHRLALLTSDSETLPERQRTLRETLRWSYDLLTPQEQAVLRRCALFPGSWPLAAAEALCGGIVAAGPEPDLLVLLRTLVDHSLIIPVRDVPGGPRFRMLETIREFGQEELAAHDELIPARQALVAWCLAYAEANQARLFGPDQVTWLNTLEQERRLFQTAAEAAVAMGDIVPALRLSWLLGRFWLVRGHHRADQAWLEAALALAREREDIDDLTHSRALLILGNAWFERGDVFRAIETYRQCAATATSAEAASARSAALLNDAIVTLKLGQVERARQAAEQALAINRELGSRSSIGKDLIILADILNAAGESGPASDLLREALAINLDLGDTRVVALTFNTMGIVAASQGDLAEAERLLQHSLAISRETGERRGIATSLYQLGQLAFGQHQVAAARVAFYEAILLRKDIGDRWGVVECAEGFARTTAASHPAAAARVLDHTAALRQGLGLEVPPAIADLRANLRDRTGRHSSSLDTVGRDPVEAIVAEARQVLDGLPADPVPAEAAPAPSSIAPPANPDRPAVKLSRREIEVLGLIVEGFQDREIAERLFLSGRTVSWHVTNILTKLGVNSRVAAAVLAIQDGLVEQRPAANA